MGGGVRGQQWQTVDLILLRGDVLGTGADES